MPFLGWQAPAAAALAGVSGLVLGMLLRFPTALAGPPCDEMPRL